ncbi:titin isoform X3 [Octopus sinensis]|uniref:Titin isoform X3 n=1 Tax=Octopus sinensis TaxID=2607531 RepID=A0A7E6F1I5_9MOLL|nr:titin isoform X3 [Octopus sinensis]
MHDLENSELNSSTSSRSLDRSNHGSYHHLPQSPSLDNVSTSSLSKAKSLDSISGDILPPRQYQSWNLPIRDISKIQEIQIGKQPVRHAKNNHGSKIFQTKDIYKEAFENTRKIEEKKFRVKFDALLGQMQKALEKQSHDDQSNISFGDIMVNYRSRIRELLSDLSQRLQLAVENYLEDDENSAASSQKVKHIVSRLVEDHLGESVDLTSDEAVSDLSSLSDDSFEGHHSYEDQLAQAVVSKVVENQRMKDLTIHSGPLDKNSIIPDYQLPQENLISQTAAVNLKTPNKSPPIRKPLCSKYVDEQVVTYEPPIKKSVVEQKESSNLKLGSAYGELSGRPLNKGINLDDVVLDSPEIDPDYVSLNLPPIKETADEEDMKDEENFGLTKFRDRNWILRRLNTKATIDEIPANHSVLVPQPEENIFPKIGDRDADDLSDLSEIDENEIEDHDMFLTVNNNSESVPNSIVATSNSPSQTVPSSRDLSPKTDISKTQDEVVSLKSKNINTVEKLPEPEEKSIPSETGDPKFVIPPVSTTGVEGEALILNCRVEGTEPVDVFWFHVGHEVVKLGDSEKYEIKKDELDRHMLTVYHPSKDDVGQYMCIAVNDMGKCTEYFIVTLDKNTQPMKIPELLKKFDDIEVRPGQLVRFRCKVKGYPPPRITWYKDGKILKASGNLKLEKFGNRDYSLSIDNATLDDDAEYCVVGRNLVGEVRHCAQLIVEPVESVSKVEESERKEVTKMTSSPKASDVTKVQPDAHNGSVGQKASEEPCVREEKHIENLSRKMTRTKDNVSHVAEDMLQSADEMTLIQHHLDFMDRTLNKLENNMPQHANPQSNDEDTLNNNEEFQVNDVFAQKVLAEYHIQDTTDQSKDVSVKKQDVPTETADEAGIEPTTVDDMFAHRVLSEHHEQKMAAEKMRKVTSTALEILEKAELAVQQQKDTENNIIPTTDYNDHLNSDDLDDPTVCYPINELSSVTESKDKLEPTDQLNIEVEAEPDVVTEQKHENKEPSTLVPESPVEGSRDLFSTQKDSSSAKPSEVTSYNFGLRPVDAERFKKDFYVNPPKKVNPNKSSNTPGVRSRDIVKTKHEVEDTEDKIYMAACSVYSLEDKIQQLEAQVGDIHEGISDSSMSALEDEVAKAMAGVEHSENEVASIEKSVEQHQNTLDHQTASLPHMSADFSTAFHKDSLKTPQKLVGVSREKDIPASRSEFDSKVSVELPSVTRLRALFNQPTRNNLGDSSVKRTDKLDPRIHSITARSLSKLQMENLKSEKSGISTISLDGKPTQRPRPSLKTIPAPGPPGGTEIITKSTKKSLAPVAPSETEETGTVKGGTAAKATFWENVVKKSSSPDNENQPVFPDLVGEDDAKSESGQKRKEN